MAIENNDLLVLQKSASGELRKATVQALLAEVVEPTPVIPDLQAVTDEGIETTNGAIFGGNVQCGDQIFGGEPSNVGVEMSAEKGALHIRAANNQGISAFEIISSGSQLSHLKILGSGDIKIGSNVNQTSTTNIELNPDGSAFFRGAIDAESIDGGEYAT